MRNRIPIWTMAAIVGLAVEGWALYVVGASPEHWRPALITEDEPAAHALYDQMMETLRSVRSLSYTSVCSGPDDRTSTYRVCLGRPYRLRVELVNGMSNKSSTLIGDGDNLWVFWSGDRPFLRVDDYQNYVKTRSDVYIRKPVLTAEDSVGDEMMRLGMAWYGTVLDPSIFHGHVDPLEFCLDGVRGRGTDTIEGEEYDVIEVGFLRAQRTRYFWLSRRDHLPRKMKEVVRGAEISVVVEKWSDVALNTTIPPTMFVWSPPESWRPWNVPRPEEHLAKSGQEAPDFELRAVQGGRVRLSDYRGKVVWLYLWQAGSPMCREEMSYLEEQYQRHQKKGLVVIGFSSADDERIVRAFLRESSVTFPNVLDSSSEAGRVMVEGYGNKTCDVPMNCIIDSQGKIVDAWLGYEKNHRRAWDALKKAGLELPE